MYSDGRKTLIKRLRRGKTAREQFVSSHIVKGIGFQIRAIRNRLRWSQDDLASRVGMTQNAVSRLESAEYGKPTITTLKRLAAAFDVGLIIRFVPFSELVDWVSGTPRLNHGLDPNALAVDWFDKEDTAGQFDRPAPQYWQINEGVQGGAVGKVYQVATNDAVFNIPTEDSSITLVPPTNIGAREVKRYEATGS